MYKISTLIITAILLLNAPSWSQKKLKLSAFTGSGISYFRGSGTTNNSVYYRSGLPFPNFSNVPDTMANPYGRKGYTNFLAGLQADIMLSSKWVLLLTAQYENTGARLTGDSVISPTAHLKINGKYSRRYDNISLNPQIGRIIFQKTITLTAHAGIDYTSKLAMGNNFEYTDQNGQKNYVGYSGDEPEVNDCRITFGASVTGKKWSLDINYKQGLTNYRKYGAGNVYTRILQLRILYSFWNKKS
jgi:hypothetical protein